MFGMSLIYDVTAGEFYYSYEMHEMNIIGKGKEKPVL